MAYLNFRGGTLVVAGSDAGIAHTPWAWKGPGIPFSDQIWRGRAPHVFPLQGCAHHLPISQPPIYLRLQGSQLIHLARFYDFHIGFVTALPFFSPVASCIVLWIRLTPRCRHHEGLPDVPPIRGTGSLPRDTLCQRTFRAIKRQQLPVPGRLHWISRGRLRRNWKTLCFWTVQSIGVWWWWPGITAVPFNLATATDTTGLATCRDSAGGGASQIRWRNLSGTGTCF